MKAKLIILPLVMLLAVFSLQAQTEVKVPEPQLSLVNGKVQIDYILQNSTSSEKFNIRIEVTSESGKSIVPKSLTGDVGPGVSGGNIRSITWDIEADNVFLDEEIYVQVIALRETPLEMVPPPTEKEPVIEAVIDENQEDLDKEEEVQVEEIKTDEIKTENKPVDEGEKTFSRAGLIFESAIFPGLGLSRLKGKPHWLKGVAAYGCLAGSIYMNRTAFNSYQDYLGARTPSIADEMFTQAESQNTISQVLFFSAVGIWVTDLVWTIAGTSDLNKQVAKNRKGISIDPGLEPMTNAPMLTFRYRF